MKRVMFVGQAMPRFKRDAHDWPSLNAWLYSVGITHQQIVDSFFYSALVDYFPGVMGSSHRVPTPQEIASQRDRLAKDLHSFNPGIVVPIGRLSIAYCLSRRVEPLEVHVGKKYLVDPYQLMQNTLPVIPLPHPSGASIWRHRTANKLLLNQALKLLKRALG